MASTYDILDLRHFSGPQLAPLLHEEAARWHPRLRWEYMQATKLLLEYLDSRVLPGFVALDNISKQILGYCFCVYEGSKAVIGDVYAFGEAASATNPLCDVLLEHLMEMLTHSPSIQRIESQLLMFPAEAFAATRARFDLSIFPRLFLHAALENETLSKSLAPLARPSSLLLQSWQPEYMRSIAELIHRAYIGHEDAGINDQYKTVAGAERFLHNIVRFPGCGLFDATNSLVLLDRTTGAPQAVLLCSRVQHDTAHITQLCVAPSLRGQGLGRRLLIQCAQNLRSQGLTHLSLTVTESNQQARALYESLGFTLRERFAALTWSAG
ncbi:MAG: GNAT family N-acetyltransferase [Acidobacteriaceae bacterium]|nr:GNAT family N-acetyltransferase [Acidobacteriaceae bacterium]